MAENRLYQITINRIYYIRQGDTITAVTNIGQQVNITAEEIGVLMMNPAHAGQGDPEARDGEGFMPHGGPNAQQGQDGREDQDDGGLMRQGGPNVQQDEVPEVNEVFEELANPDSNTTPMAWIQRFLDEGLSRYRPNPNSPNAPPRPQEGGQDLGAISPEDNVGNYFAEELAEKFSGDSEHERAISLLQQLPITQRQQMILAECYFQTSRDDRAAQCIRNMKTLSSRQPRLEATDAFKLGSTNLEKAFYFKAMTSLACAAKLHLFAPNGLPDERVRGIEGCAIKFCKVMVAMVGTSERMRLLAGSIGMELMNGIVDDILAVKGADPYRKAVSAAVCLNNAGACYHLLKNPRKAIECSKRGAKIMLNRFGERASKFSVFSFLLNNIGAHLLKNPLVARKLFQLVIEMENQAVDWENDEKRVFLIQQTQKNLRKVSPTT